MWLQKYTISRLTSFLTGEDVFKDDDLSMLQGEIKLTIYFLNKFCYRIRKEKIIEYNIGSHKQYAMYIYAMIERNLYTNANSKYKLD